MGENIVDYVVGGCMRHGNGQVTSDAGMSNSPTSNWLDNEQIQRLLEQGTSQQQQQLMSML